MSRDPAAARIMHTGQQNGHGTCWFSSFWGATTVFYPISPASSGGPGPLRSRKEATRIGNARRSAGRSGAGTALRAGCRAGAAPGFSRASSAPADRWPGPPTPAGVPLGAARSHAQGGGHEAWRRLLLKRSRATRSRRPRNDSARSEAAQLTSFSGGVRTSRMRPTAYSTTAKANMPSRHNRNPIPSSLSRWAITSRRRRNGNGVRSPQAGGVGGHGGDFAFNHGADGTGLVDERLSAAGEVHQGQPLHRQPALWVPVQLDGALVGSAVDSKMLRYLCQTPRGGSSSLPGACTAGDSASGGNWSVLRLRTPGSRRLHGASSQNQAGSWGGLPSLAARHTALAPVRVPASHRQAR